MRSMSRTMPSANSGAQGTGPEGGGAHQAVAHQQVHACPEIMAAAVKDAHGVVTNAVLIMHGTGGWGGQVSQPIFAAPLFGPGQLLWGPKN